jgi:hypothetical protein
VLPDHRIVLREQPLLARHVDHQIRVRLVQIMERDPLDLPHRIQHRAIRLRAMVGGVSEEDEDRAGHRGKE